MSRRPLSGEDSIQVPLIDRLGRPMTDLRLSVTDRCNFRCAYCMPRTKSGPVAPLTQRANLLDFDQITTMASAFVGLGVSKVRITGGEPLVRRDLPRLVEKLSRLKISDLCMTTNGSLLAEHARALSDAGLNRVTVSLDALDEVTFKRVTDSSTPLAKVLDGIDVTRACGVTPVKINTVVQRGVNEHSIIPMADWARREHLELRFIEYMDVGCSNGWQPSNVVTVAEIRRLIHRIWPIEPVPRCDEAEPAQRFAYRDGAGHVGFIASISQPFCARCTRARVSSVGALYPCLFAPMGLDSAPTLRRNGDLRSLIAAFWRTRIDRYSELRSHHTAPRPRPEMSAIGG